MEENLSVVGFALSALKVQKNNAIAQKIHQENSRVLSKSKKPQTFLAYNLCHLQYTEQCT